MGDAGEGLVDAEDRFQEYLAEREQERRRDLSPVPRDPERERIKKSLELACADLKRQESSAPEGPRRKQIGQALADLEHRLAELG
jgi:hypothetical protein